MVMSRIVMSRIVMSRTVMSRTVMSRTVMSREGAPAVRGLGGVGELSRVLTG